MTHPTGGTPFYDYCIFGLHIRFSTPLPGLHALSSRGNADVIVTITETEERYPQPERGNQVYASPGVAENGEPHFKVWNDPQRPSIYLGIQYTDGREFVSFLINQEGNQVQVFRPEAVPFNDMLTYFLGPVIGCILRLRRITSIHAGVVAVGGKALAIIGPKNIGKSTIVAAMAYDGLPVLSDDIASLSEVNGQMIVAPGYPRLRLWPETIDAFSNISVETLPRILSFTEKRFVDLSADRDVGRWQFQHQPLPLAAVYALGGRGPDDRLSIRSHSKAESLFVLMRNTYPEYPLHPGDHARNFTSLQRLASLIPLREVILPDSLDSLSQIRNAILDDFKLSFFL